MNTRRGLTVQDEQQIQEIKKTLELFHEGRLVEIRALNVPRGRATIVVSGYFDDYDLAAKAAWELDQAKSEGVYMNINDLHPGCLARAANRLEDSPHDATSANDVSFRRYLLIDIDVTRPKGISSTAAELQRAYDLRTDVTNLIVEAVDPVWMAWCCSGNGYHLVVDNWSFGWDAGSESDQIKAFLKGLDLTVAADSGCSIDEAVHDESRITKLYGTMARKGDNISVRPHRRSFVEAVWRKLDINSDGTRSGHVACGRVLAYNSGRRLLGSESVCPGG